MQSSFISDFFNFILCMKIQLLFYKQPIISQIYYLTFKLVITFLCYFFICLQFFLFFFKILKYFTTLKTKLYSQHRMIFNLVFTFLHEPCRKVIMTSVSLTSGRALNLVNIYLVCHITDICFFRLTKARSLMKMKCQNLQLIYRDHRIILLDYGIWRKVACGEH